MSTGGNRIRLSILEVRHQHGNRPRGNDAIDQLVAMLMIEAAVKHPIQQQHPTRVQVNGQLILIGHHHEFRFRNGPIHRPSKHP